MIRQRAAGWAVLGAVAAVCLSLQSPTGERASGVPSRHTALYVSAPCDETCSDDSSWGGRVITWPTAQGKQRLSIHPAGTVHVNKIDSAIPHLQGTGNPHKDV